MTWQKCFYTILTVLFKSHNSNKVVEKIRLYLQENFNQSINHGQMRKHLDGTTKRGWYKEVDINGVSTKLHWRDC